jgi:hypothetical protein
MLGDQSVISLTGLDLELSTCCFRSRESEKLVCFLLQWMILSKNRILSRRQWDRKASHQRTATRPLTTREISFLTGLSSCEFDPKTPFDALTVTRPSSARPTIPRRGEKEFEPQPGGGSGLQVHVLDRSRNAMFGALRTTRTISRCCHFIPALILSLSIRILYSKTARPLPMQCGILNSPELMLMSLEAPCSHL